VRGATGRVRGPAAEKIGPPSPRLAPVGMERLYFRFQSSEAPRRPTARFFGLLRLVGALDRPSRGTAGPASSGTLRLDCSDLSELWIVLPEALLGQPAVAPCVWTDPTCRSSGSSYRGHCWASQQWHPAFGLIRLVGALDRPSRGTAGPASSGTLRLDCSDLPELWIVLPGALLGQPAEWHTTVHFSLLARRPWRRALDLSQLLLEMCELRGRLARRSTMTFGHRVSRNRSSSGMSVALSPHVSPAARITRPRRPSQRYGDNPS
jgi:hypothetical protein